MPPLQQDQEITNLSNREKWILRLLFAPSGEGYSNSIEGRTRLVKGLFLVERMFSEKFTDFQGTGFDFRAYKYGPFDKDIYTSLERLEEAGFVKENKMPEHKGDLIRLTDDGEVLGRESYNELTEEKQTQLRWIKQKHVQQPVAQLLSFVYNRYPKTAENSEFKSV